MRPAKLERLRKYCNQVVCDLLHEQYVNTKIHMKVK